MSDDAFAIVTRVFQGVHSDVVQHIFDCGTVRSFPKDTVLIREGDVKGAFYILLEGQADIYEFYEGENHRLGYLEPGQSFGELSLIMDAPRNADIIATEPIMVLEIERADFETGIMANPDALLAVVRLVLTRILGQMDRKLGEVARRKLRESYEPEVFISYSRTDEKFARKLASDLIKQKINVWMDVFHINSGESWARQIGEALDACQIMLLVLSPDSIVSENVEDEWNYYLDKRKVILPVLHRPCDVPYRLHKLQYIDFVNKPYDSALSQVIIDCLAALP